jgi:hypothetical protein
MLVARRVDRSRIGDSLGGRASPGSKRDSHKSECKGPGCGTVELDASNSGTVLLSKEDVNLAGALLARGSCTWGQG